MRLALEAAGHGPPLLFLHGVGSDRATWRPQLAALRRGRLAVAVDCRGHGESVADPASISLAGMAADAAELIESLPGSGAHVCGLSMGAIIALQLWADRPELVRGLVLAGGWASHPEAAASLPQRLAGIDASTMPDMARRRMPALFGPGAPPHLVERSVAAMAAKDHAVYRRSNEVLWGADMRHVASTIRVPVTVIVGELDPVTPPALSRELARLIPGARLVVIPGVGHLSNEEDPAAFNAALRAHLRRRAPAGRRRAAAGDPQYRDLR